MSNIFQEIAASAKKAKICPDFYKKMMETKDVKELADMYFDHDDWSGEYDFPSIESLKKFKSEADKNFIFLNAKNRKIENKPRAAFLGESTAKVICSDFEVSKIIVRHQSKVEIIANKYAKVFINLIDDAHVTVLAEDNAQVIIYRYSENSNFTITGNVKVVASQWQK